MSRFNFMLFEVNVTSRINYMSSFYKTYGKSN
jgi:hypothetical protein